MTNDDEMLGKYIRFKRNLFESESLRQGLIEKLEELIVQAKANGASNTEIRLLPIDKVADILNKLQASQFTIETSVMQINELAQQIGESEFNLTS